MYPVLFSFGKFTIHTYGFFVALGFAAGLTAAKYDARQVGENPEKILDLCFYMLIAAVICSRIFYILTNFRFFVDDPLEIFRIWNGGLVFYGGFLGGMGVIVFYLKKHRMPFGRTLDILSPALAIGHSIGRIGCFFAGCCYGKTCGLPWAVTFTRRDSLAPVGIPLHPTQLYESISNLIIFFILWRFRRIKSYDGQVALLYMFLYGSTRAILEIVRGDDRGGFLFGVLSVSQVIGLALSLFALGMLFYHKQLSEKKHRKRKS